MRIPIRLAVAGQPFSPAMADTEKAIDEVAGEIVAGTAKADEVRERLLIATAKHRLARMGVADNPDALNREIARLRTLQERYR